jgi:hypothetical protein
MPKKLKGKLHRSPIRQIERRVIPQVSMPEVSELLKAVSKCSMIKSDNTRSYWCVMMDKGLWARIIEYVDNSERAVAKKDLSV